MLYVEFRCHIIRFMLSGVGGIAEVGQGHAVCGCRNGCVCLVWVWRRGWCVSRCMGGVGVYVAGEWVQVLMENRWHLPRCCGCDNNLQLLHQVSTSRHFHIWCTVTHTSYSLFVILQYVKVSSFNSPPPPPPKFRPFFHVTVFQEASAFKFVGAFRFPNLGVGVLQYKPWVITVFECAQLFQKCRSYLKIVATALWREPSFMVRTHRH